ncbi:uncharacterized protein LOC119263820 [Pygocentrus nattereri]|uniref:uncharacterized protein LOC119263820 n=1 Tax=Pygocentrus nattereri TaxID=42514 RepID=UPI001891AD10|nr:uncharacterized protein LOC119263820 [Pygocentrus nattereri]
MAQIRILILCLYITGSAQAVDLSEASFVSAEPAEPQLNVSVVQSPAWRSVSPGESVTQQCMVHSKTGAAELRVLCFSKNNFSHSDAGTYYCAVAACGKIIVSNQASVQLKGPVDPVVIFLGAALGVCVVVISAETIIIFKRRNSDHGSEKKQQGASAENTTNQTAESLNYAPIHFKENKPKPGRMKREQPEDIVYSQVRSSNAKAHRSLR